MNKSDCPCFNNGKGCMLRNEMCHIDCSNFLTWKANKDTDNKIKNAEKFVEQTYKGFLRQQKTGSMKYGRNHFNSGIRS